MLITENSVKQINAVILSLQKQIDDLTSKLKSIKTEETTEPVKKTQKAEEQDDPSAYVPVTRTVNGKSLDHDITLNAGDVGALPSSYTAPVSSVNNKTGAVTLNYADVGALPDTYAAIVTSVNSQTGDVVLDASDVGALPDTYTPPVSSVNSKTGAVILNASDVGALPDTYTPPVTSVNSQTGAVSLTASDVGALPDTYTAPVTSVNTKTGAVTLSASDVGAATPADVSTAEANAKNLANATGTLAVANGGTGQNNLNTITIGAADNTGSKITVKGITDDTNTYADTNPKLEFQNAGATENISLTFTDSDTVQSPASLTLNGNQGGEYFIAPNIKATSGFSGDLTGNVTGVSTGTYAINQAVVCNTAGDNATKTADLPGFQLVRHTRLIIRIVNANTAVGPVTLNINDTGAKTIKRNGTLTSASTYGIAAGYYNAYYDGTYWCIDSVYMTSDARSSLTSSRLGPINIDSIRVGAGQARISLNQLMTWLITTKGYIPSNTQCYLCMATPWSYNANDILQFTANGTNYELQLAGVVIEFMGTATNYNTGVFRLRIHSSPKDNFTVTSGYQKFPVSSIAEYTCNGSNYQPAWKAIATPMTYSSGSGYWCLTNIYGETNTYVCAPQRGFLPYQSGNQGDGHGNLGTNLYWWKRAYIDDIYGYLNGDISGSAGSVDTTWLLNAVYPVGAVYMSVDHTSPDSIFGGTWVEITTGDIYTWKRTV